jgi:hypothetical protein
MTKQIYKLLQVNHIRGNAYIIKPSITGLTDGTGLWSGFIWLKRFPVLGYFEEEIESWCSIQSGHFLDYLTDLDLLNYAVIRVA